MTSSRSLLIRSIFMNVSTRFALPHKMTVGRCTERNFRVLWREFVGWREGRFLVFRERGRENERLILELGSI